MSECKHETDPQNWIDTSYTDDDGYYHSDGHWELGKSLWVDIDLHRYKCSGCGKVGYYSEKARRHYEEGTGELTR